MSSTHSEGQRHIFYFDNLMTNVIAIQRSCRPILNFVVIFILGPFMPAANIPNQTLDHHKLTMIPFWAPIFIH